METVKKKTTYVEKDFTPTNEIDNSYENERFEVQNIILKN